MNFTKQLIILFLFLIFILTFTESYATITGKVLDAKNSNPIKYAKVKISPQNEITLTDKNGLFSIKTNKDKVDLIISSMGYKIEKIKDLPADTTIVVKLKINPIKITGVSVKGDRKNSITTYSIDHQIIELNDILLKDNHEIIESYSGIYIHENNTGEKSISLNGCDPKQVAILIDGVRVNSNINSFNIDKIPSSMVEKIEIIPHGSSSLVGDTAIGGIVNLVLKKPSIDKPKNTLSFGIGSWENYSGSYTANINLKNLSFLININMKKIKNDFLYFNEFEDKEIRRINNSYSNKAISLTSNTFLNNKIMNDFSFFMQNAVRGIPGQSTDYMYYEKAKAKAFLLDIKNKFQYQNKNSIMNFLISYQFQKSHYDNKEADIFHQYNSENITNCLNSEIEWKLFKNSFNNTVKFVLRNEDYKFEDLLNDNIDNSIPRKYRTFLSLINLSKYLYKTKLLDLIIKPNLRFDFIINDKNIYSYSLGIKAIPNFTKKIILSFNFSNSYRLPKFTSLFWKGDSRVQGNPNLKPEKSKEISMKLSWETDFFESFVSISNNTIDDLIYWYRSAMGVWKPENLARADITCINGGLNIRIYSWLKIYSSFTKLYPMNKTKESDHYNNYLIYKPLHKINNKIQFNFGDFGFNFSNKFIGKQYDNFDNNVVIDGYRLIDFNIYFKISLKKNFEFLGKCWINNILNKRYENYRHIPAPGRNYELKLQISSNLWI